MDFEDAVDSGVDGAGVDGVDTAEEDVTGDIIHTTSELCQTQR